MMFNKMSTRMEQNAGPRTPEMGETSAAPSQRHGSIAQPQIERTCENRCTSCKTYNSTAIGLVRLYEARELSHKRANSGTSRTALQTRSFTGPAPNKISPLIKKLTPEEVNETRKKGLCFRYNEKFGPGHQCKKLFTIQAVLEESDSDVEMEVEEGNEEAVLDTPEISVHAIAGLRAPKTMQVGGSMQSKSVTVLIDSGNTHNFISESAARRVGLQPKTEGKMEVMVASGEKLNCPDKCSNVQLKLQRIPIVAEFFILPLEGYDIVMGTQWLQTLGPIQWDFSKLYMTFCLNGRKVTLQGLNN
ncbi:hypothetical protein JRO89_XS04G0228500 [Xanthoceras sorbifolium]|uniref:Uncharacterized protein n=1 Tax=Xanthoceras sorbifolium TaxID=99658 RepID=A0ABQ8I6K4_9ROSI|nr:hypothetical protein JRO89_XS04G0228500 [Xanthoceras sorbifolium]